MGYLTSALIETKIGQLATQHSARCRKIAMNEPTNSEGPGPTSFSTSYSYLEIANGSGAGRPTLLIVAGQHAREWAQPDAVLFFAEQLLKAYDDPKGYVIDPYTDRKGNSYKEFTVDQNKVRRMIDTLTILIVPLANPDGRAFSQDPAGDSDWRKNRAVRQNLADPLTIGVDLNRNHPFAWQYEDFYDPVYLPDLKKHTSDDPKEDTYRGPAPVAGVPPPPGPPTTGPLSQPEVRNIHFILDHNPVTWCIDLHSFWGSIMYPWGTEANGTNSAQNFREKTLHKKWDGPFKPFYSEYMPPALLQKLRPVALAMARAIKTTTGRDYEVNNSGIVPYEATGCLSDSFFSRQFLPGGGPELMSFEIEFGLRTDPDDGFQPLNSPGDPNHPFGYPKIEREVQAALLAFIEAALPPLATVAPPTPGGGSSGPCLLSIALADLAHGTLWLAVLRQARAELRAGRVTAGPMVALERGYRQLSRVLGPTLARQRWARRAVAFGVAAPAAGIAALAMRAARR
jgi:hypothetical protein